MNSNEFSHFPGLFHGFSTGLFAFANYGLILGSIMPELSNVFKASGNN